MDDEEDDMDVDHAVGSSLRSASTASSAPIAMLHRKRTRVAVSAGEDSDHSEDVTGRPRRLHKTRRISDSEDGADEVESIESAGSFIVHDTDDGWSEIRSPGVMSQISEFSSDESRERAQAKEAHRERIRTAIREIMNDPQAREKDEDQMEALEVVTQQGHLSDMICIMKTGGGKSLLWQVPVKMDPKLKIMVVCPFTALLQQQLQKAQDAKLRAVSFAQYKSPPADVQILFVQVEHTMTEPFKT